MFCADFHLSVHYDKLNLKPTRHVIIMFTFGCTSYANQRYSMQKPSRNLMPVLLKTIGKHMTTS